MHHVAIMRPEWKFIAKILSGEKTVETRWYRQKRCPWGRIGKGDAVFFKDAGKPVSAKSFVSKVEEVVVRDDSHRKELLERIGRREIGADDPRIWEKVEEYTKGKRYMIAVWLEGPERVEPFQISKHGFGMMASWICVDDISLIAVDGYVRKG